MNSTSTALLLTAATLMVTFAGFSVLFLAIRQGTGRQISPVDLFLTRRVVVHLFTMTAGALLPVLLSVYGVSEQWTWKVSALLFGLPMLSLLLTYRWRRIAVTGKPPTVFGNVVLVGLGSLTNVVMIAYVCTSLPNIAAAYISGLLANFFILAFTFAQALEIIIREKVDDPREGS